MRPKRKSPTGIRARHSRSCPAHAGGDRCNCRPYWEASVYSRRDGKKVRKSFPTLAAAKAWRADAQSAANKGRLRAPASTTISQAAETLLAGMRDGTIRNRKGRPYKPSTIRSYNRALQLRLLPEFGARRLGDLSRLDVQDFADRLLADGIDPSTITNTLDPLRVIYRRARQREEVAVDPTEELELARPRGRRDRIASPEEARRLLDALPDEDRALWATALYAGLRRGELRALRFADIDLARRELRVERAWDPVEGEIDGKSDAAARTVPVLAVLVADLAQHKLRTGRDGDDLVFGTTASLPFEPSTVRRRALAAWKREKLDPIGLHEARHTFASLLIAAGVNAKAICEAMGHASITMTFDRYGHLMPGGRDEARDRVDDYLSKSSKSVSLGS